MEKEIVKEGGEKQMNDVYILYADDLTHLGGPMGTEEVTTETLGVFVDVEAAKNVAQEDYNKHRDGVELIWVVSGNETCTLDYGFVMYRILKMEVRNK